MVGDDAVNNTPEAPVIRMETVSDQGVLVTVSGEIDLLPASVLDATLAGADGERNVIVDCEAVQFLDSTGLSVLLRHLQRFEEGGGSLRLRHPSGPVRHVVEVAGLTDVLLTSDDD
jgi:anti-sigma B factor antagonist